MTTKTRSTTKPLQILLPPEQHQRFKAVCSLRGLKMTEVTTTLIYDWIEKQLQENQGIK